MYWIHGPFWGLPAFLGMGLVMVLFWAGLIALAVVIGRTVRGFRPVGPGPSNIGAAEQILAERFARGEIDEGTYRKQVDIIRTRTWPNPRSES
jgi:putative membrane protein